MDPPVVTFSRLFVFKASARLAHEKCNLVTNFHLSLAEHTRPFITRRKQKDFGSSVVFGGNCFWRLCLLSRWAIGDFFHICHYGRHGTHCPAHCYWPTTLIEAHSELKKAQMKLQLYCMHAEMMMNCAFFSIPVANMFEINGGKSSKCIESDDFSIFGLCQWSSSAAAGRAAMCTFAKFKAIFLCVCVHKLAFAILQLHERYVERK